MTVNEALERLKALGNDKVRKHNLKFGASENQYGVKLGDIRALAKTIGSDHALAKALWKTGNVDAQLLATQILDVNALSLEELDEMVKSGGFSQVADWLNAYVVKEHPDKEKMREDWMDSDNFWAARAGWSLTAGRVVRSADGLNLPGLLDRIETEMPSAPPEVQWTMNTTLAQIGINHPDYRERALRIGETLGVFRDYPVSKGCTSPFAPIWISEMVKRQGVKS
ncbi:DNA alkylation repair protein [Flavisolibacter sp. BT320]|nr:DNA alkylation repair protein [Flavisolibacter longurius]